MAAEGMQSHDQSRGNCPNGIPPTMKKGRINAPILPKPARCAKSDRLLEQFPVELGRRSSIHAVTRGLDRGHLSSHRFAEMMDARVKPAHDERVDQIDRKLW